MSTSHAARRRGDARFKAPQVAKPLATRAAWIFFACLVAAGTACAAFVGNAAFWPASMPLIAVPALAVVFAVANNFGTFRTVEGVTEHASLGMPVAFAMMLLLDWRLFVLSIALGEILSYASNRIRRTNVRLWYMHVANVALYACCGASAVTVTRMLSPLWHGVGGTAWLSVGPGLTLVFAALMWRICDNVTTSLMVTFAAKRSLWTMTVPARVFFSQFALFLIGIPFARLWSDNVWLSLFALAPLGVAYRLLDLPELEYRARTDERTGLTNAGAFDRVIKAEIEAASTRGHGIVLLAIDIDHFKRVNDTFGHPVGDVVIARFAEILAEAASAEDVAARTGGEEFALLLRDAPRATALAFAERLRRIIEEESFAVEGLDVPIKLTASIGVALFPTDGRTASELFEAADGALYAAKHGGRNVVREAAKSFSMRPVLPIAPVSPVGEGETQPLSY